jgi:dTDP-glucose pyrophosphorylase
MEIANAFISSDSTIRKAMACIDRNAHGIALVIDKEQRLLGTITDGDIRRAILDHLDIDVTVSELLKRRSCTPYPTPITASLGTARPELLQLMTKNAVRQIPLLDEDGRVAGLVTWDELLPGEVLALQAVIMAGGEGTRLRPLTDDKPKPLLPIGDRPTMELIVGQLRKAGIRRVNVTTHYKGEQIAEHFGDGSNFGVEIRYVTEDRPLGTAGGLGLMEKPEEPLLVVNGDIVTQVDFRAMYAFHKEHNADLTLAVREYDLGIPYGVIESDGPHVTRLSEKPVHRFFVNAGIYLLEPAVCRYIPRGEPFDMTDLIQLLLEEGRPVVSFPIIEYWLDIGRPSDYNQVQEDVERGKI